MDPKQLREAARAALENSDRHTSGRWGYEDMAGAVIPLIARHVIEESARAVETTPSVWRREGTEDAEATLDEAASRVRALIATYEEPKP